MRHDPYCHETETVRYDGRCSGLPIYIMAYNILTRPKYLSQSCQKPNFIMYQIESRGHYVMFSIKFSICLCLLRLKPHATETSQGPVVHTEVSKNNITLGVKLRTC